LPQQTNLLLTARREGNLLAEANRNAALHALGRYEVYFSGRKSQTLA
jgi:hypothetical protein